MSSDYINRELSWLEFNQRVLDEARDTSIPLLERLKFLAITGSNLDEFFMVRVGGLTVMRDAGSTKRDPAGMTANDQLEAISGRTHELASEQYACFNELLPLLDDAGIRQMSAKDLSEEQYASIEQVFLSDIAPILSPQVVSDFDKFPLLAGRQLQILAKLAPDPDSDEQEQGPRLAVIPCGQVTPRFLTVRAESGYQYMLLEDAIEEFVHRFFVGQEVQECVPFRITRNADMAIREDQAADLLAGMEQLLVERRSGDCVRLEIPRRASEDVRTFLQSQLDLSDDFVYLIDGPLDLSAFMQLTDVGRKDLSYESWPPQPSPEVDPLESMFSILSQRDVLLYHPYDSFDPVVRFLNEAADDPDVLAIKQTLYRTSRNSSIVAALARAAENGKYVTAIVELKARFDEARNIEWASALERSGVQVIYGVKGLKTHAKICLVVRREMDGIRRYLHFGTGNYNESTARLYSDVSYMTSSDQLGSDATNFFNSVTGFSQPMAFAKIDVAPFGLRERIVELIEAETKRKKQGQKARIAVKLNSLVDPTIISKLYEASQAGVQIRLSIRGICCLRPGVEGLSDNIQVISVIDRYLEHARILYFYHGGDERLYISSADWMQRNLNRRVELLVPIEDTTCRQELISILDTSLRDGVKGSTLQPDGSYLRNTGPADSRSQQVLYEAAVEAVRQYQMSRRTALEPHHAKESKPQ